MAWNVKPSATTQIPRRKDPYLTAAMMEKYRAEILPRYQTTMGALMPGGAAAWIAGQSMVRG